MAGEVLQGKEGEGFAMRHAPKVDRNQGEIVRYLQQIGCSVVSLAAAGKGIPDLLVGRRCVNVLIEVKDPTQPKHNRKLTPAQVAFHRSWRGQIAVAYTPQEAEAIVNAAEKWAGGQ